MAERHEIPKQQVERLRALRAKQQEMTGAVIRAKAALYDAIIAEKVAVEELRTAAQLVCGFIEIDPEKNYTLTADCSAFELGDTK